MKQRAAHAAGDVLQALSLLMIVAAVLFSAPKHAFSQPINAAGQPEWVTRVIGQGASKEIVDKFTPRLTDWDSAISALEREAASRTLSSASFQKASDLLTKTRTEITAFVEQLTPLLEAARARLEKLGLPPKEGETEAEDIADQRKSIADEVAAYDGLIKRAEVLKVRVEQVVANYGALRRQQFVDQILRRTDAFTERWFWSNIGTVIQQQTNRSLWLVQDWVNRSLKPFWPAVLALGAISAMLAWLSSLLLHAILRSSPATIAYPVQTQAERGAITLRRTVSRAVPFAVGLLSVWLIGVSFQLWSSDEAYVLGRCFIYASVAIFLLIALKFALRPVHASERLVAIDDRSATWISWILSLIVLVWLGDQVFALLDQQLSSPFQLVVLRSLVAALLVSVLLALLLLVRIKRENAAPVTIRTNGWPRWLFGLIGLATFIILGATALGYVSLGRFLSGQLATMGGLLLFVTLVHLTAEFLSSPRSAHAGEEDGQHDRTVVGATLGVALGLALDLLVLLIVVPLMLLQWGYAWTEVRGWISAAVFGFQIGDFKVSLLAVFISLAILVVGMLLTRLVRSMFERRSAHVFSTGSGTRDSIATVLTYVGFVASLIAAVSYLGFSVSNLALIAGALSVGIGFGLQSVANNFVSGLILLAERPIKVGDWIVVGDREGVVQRISVRSTQIRTFDRSTVIVPNADLITGQVVNWNHGDRVGRVFINVGVAYGTPPRKVLDLLLQIGRDYPLALSNPASPLAVFEGFGDSSLDFSLRILIADVSNRLTAQNDLRVAIVEAFEREGIEIPFPQRDVWVRQQAEGDAK